LDLLCVFVIGDRTEPSLFGQSQTRGERSRSV
jgi:hypothetical protein